MIVISSGSDRHCCLTARRLRGSIPWGPGGFSIGTPLIEDMHHASCGRRISTFRLTLGMDGWMDGRAGGQMDGLPSMNETKDISC